MTVLIVEVYDALLDAGASEEKARAAAKALAENRNRFSKIRADLTLLKWMIGAGIGLSVAILVKLLV